MKTQSTLGNPFTGCNIPQGSQVTPGVAETLQRHCTHGAGKEMNLLVWGFLICHRQQEAPGAGATTVHGLVAAVMNPRGHFLCVFNGCIGMCWTGSPLVQPFAKATFLNQDFIGGMYL